MNANAKLNQILKESAVKRPSHFNQGNLFTTKFESTKPESAKEKILTDEELGLKPTRRVPRTTENKEE